ncbi:MAG TPA: gluconate 2-dehydrogenase subunit 3 family protein [Steroidobacteraceae bacterium]|nr:gluconate 2-dehydrogenase subunit 3 family protein [Steroidobacteraceae bacterium]
MSEASQNPGKDVSDHPGTTINRRSLMLGAVFMLGGAAALTRFVSKPYAGENPTVVFSPEQFALLEQAVDVVIPRTDTPGALDAGVPAFMRQMLAEWASPATRADIISVLENIERRAWNKFGAAFRELPAERRLEVMRALDDEGMAREDLAYGKFKSLLLVSYYQSEIGATQELRFELVPGAWRSCLPLSEVGRASAV